MKTRRIQTLMPATLIGALAVALPSDLEAAVLGVKKEIPARACDRALRPFLPGLAAITDSFCI